MFPLWQKKGHVSANCTIPPHAKRKKATDVAGVIIDMSSWAEEFAQWRESQLTLASAEPAPGLPSGVVVDADAGVTTPETGPHLPDA